MNYWFAFGTAVLGIAFLCRVAGHLVQVISPVGFLPPAASWQGSDLPYPVLLTSQIAILGLIGWVSTRMAAGRSVFPSRWGSPVIVLGAIYFGAMAARLVLGLTTMADVKWFAASIPAIFHLVLASAAILTGAYARALSSKAGRDA